MSVKIKRINFTPQDGYEVNTTEGKKKFKNSCLTFDNPNLAAQYVDDVNFVWADGKTPKGLMKKEDFAAKQGEANSVINTTSNDKVGDLNDEFNMQDDDEEKEAESDEEKVVDDNEDVSDDTLIANINTMKIKELKKLAKERSIEIPTKKKDGKDVTNTKKLRELLIADLKSN